MASQCYMGTVALDPGTSTLATIATLPTSSTSSSTSSATFTCSPAEGLCYYSISRAEGRVTAQLGCWPSQVYQPRAWLAQPECLHEVDRLVCLCTSDLCNLRLPEWEEEQPEGTQGQFLLVLLLLLLCLAMVSVAAYFQCRSWRAPPPPDLEASPPSPRRHSRCPLLPTSYSPSPPPPLLHTLSSCSEPPLGTFPWLPPPPTTSNSWPSPPSTTSNSPWHPPPSSTPSTSQHPPALLRVCSAPPSIPSSRVRTNLAFLLQEQQQHNATLHEGLVYL